MSNQRAIFLGAGIHTCLGKGVEANLQALTQLPPPPEMHRCELIDEQPMIPFKLLAGSPAENLEHRLYEVVMDVAEQALTEAGLDQQQRSQMGLFVGSSSFDVSVTEACFQRELAVNSNTVPMGDPSIAKLANELVTLLGIKGPDYSFNTACTSSANALVAAINQVEEGLIDFALVLGVELYNDVTALGFHSLELLSDSGMKPFDADRGGMVLGEGASALVVGKPPTSNASHSLANFCLLGSANLSDNYSISASNPNGRCIAMVMEQALERAGLRPEQVAALKVHGTASFSGDESEAKGMHAVFSQLPVLCAIKPFIGHSLGACGLTELILFYRAVEAGFLIATPGISASAGNLGVILNQHNGISSPGHFMLNYFGFGGNNTSLIISNSPAQEVALNG